MTHRTQNDPTQSVRMYTRKGEHKRTYMRAVHERSRKHSCKLRKLFESHTSMVPGAITKNNVLNAYRELQMQLLSKTNAQVMRSESGGLHPTDDSAARTHNCSNIHACTKFEELKSYFRGTVAQIGGGNGDVYPRALCGKPTLGSAIDDL